jgi:hypothetical protein
MKKILKVGLVAGSLLGASNFAFAGDSPAYKHDEAKNKPGPNRCTSDNDCDGKRTCSGAHWCQGTSR